MDEKILEAGREALRNSIGISHESFMQLAWMRIDHGINIPTNLEKEVRSGVNELLQGTSLVRPGHATLVAMVFADYIATSVFLEGLEGAQSMPVKMLPSEKDKLIYDLSEKITSMVVDRIKSELDKLRKEKGIPIIFEGKNLKDFR